MLKLTLDTEKLLALTFSELRMLAQKLNSSDNSLAMFQSYPCFQAVELTIETIPRHDIVQREGIPEKLASLPKHFCKHRYCVDPISIALVIAFSTRSQPSGRASTYMLSKLLIWNSGVQKRPHQHLMQLLIQ